MYILYMYLHTHIFTKGSFRGAHRGHCVAAHGHGNFARLVDHLHRQPHLPPFGFGIQGFQGSGFRVQGAGFKVQGSGFRVQGFQGAGSQGPTCPHHS